LRDGRIKIPDFGSAKFATKPQTIAATAAPTAGTVEKHLGTALGTIAYMSAEQVRGKELDSRTDLFSFGAVLYEMSTGREAFASNTPGVTFEAILNGMPTAPVRLNPEVHPKLEEIISKALEKDRDIRYQHASELRTDLRRLKRGVDLGETQGQALCPSNNGRHKVCPYAGGGHGSRWWE
jgi:eukaryotic-like serine/threonine-protein kinase